MLGAAFLLALTTTHARAFVNGGFESGNLNGWNTQIVACGSSSLPTVTVVGAGIATNTCGLLTTPLSGSYCAALYSGYLVSGCTHAAIEQDAVLPWTNTILEVSFSAVVEAVHAWKGPACSTPGSPYVRLFVEVVGGPALYGGCYDSCTPLCDPGQIPASCAFPLGCQFNGIPGGTLCDMGCATGSGSSQWSVLPWCTMQLPIYGYQGLPLRIRLEAWECSYGGHRSYAFLDSVTWFEPSPLPTGTPRPTATPTATPDPATLPDPGPLAVAPSSFVYGSGSTTVSFFGIPRGAALIIFNARGEFVAELAPDTIGRADLPMYAGERRLFARGVYVAVVRRAGALVRSRHASLPATRSRGMRPGSRAVFAVR